MNSSKIAAAAKIALHWRAQSPATSAAMYLTLLCLATNSMLPASGETLQGQVTTVEEVPLVPLVPTEVDLNSFIGVWKVEIPKIRRKPTVTITSVSDKQVQGIYKGLLGTFPLWGDYQTETGEVRMFVDFSRSKLARMTRKSEKAIAHMTGKVNLADRTISGSASLPEFSSRVFAFNGKKADSKL
ncbi:hypothetical protein KBI23_04030 [bacterium]|nr:hypothetical protein [bacterium]MBP9809960.1 hypothetical protein [bacterium]